MFRIYNIIYIIKRLPKLEFWAYVSYYTTSRVHFWFGPSWGVYIPGVAPSAWFQPRSIALPRLKSMILLFSSRATKFPSNLQSFPNPHAKGSLVSLLMTWFPKSVVYLKENYLSRRSSITKQHNSFYSEVVKLLFITYHSCPPQVSSLVCMLPVPSSLPNIALPSSWLTILK